MNSFGKDDRASGKRGSERTHSTRGRQRDSSGSEADFEMSMAACGAIDRTVEWLHEQQSPAGFWCGELEGDSILESEYILLLAWLGMADTPKAQKAARYLLKTQRAEGGWGMYPGGELEISASVKAYFALKITGQDPTSEPMLRAKAAIRDHGGADAVNSFTRFYLALLGQIDFELCPAVPPEAMLAPSWFPFSIYRISAWSRTIFVPLSIVWAYRPVRPVRRDHRIDELFLESADHWGPLRSPGANESEGRRWRGFFAWADRTLKRLERWRLRPLRNWALGKAERWMTKRFAYSDGLGAIFPPIIWSAIALLCRGYDESSAEVTYCLEQLEALILEDDDSIRLQPCQSPVWDTANTLRALQASGVESSSPAIRRSVHWLLSKEITLGGDWAATVRAKPGGWCFQHNNEFYPDVDDTIMVMMALREHVPDGEALVHGDVLVSSSRASSLHDARQEAGTVEQIASSCFRAREWVLAMQNRDGGWGAFDRNNNYQFLSHVPFADHNAMIDPSTPDITARVLECLAAWGLHQGRADVDRAVEYLRQTQEPDGAWYGRWGVNYIYGVWQCLVGLRAIGVPADDPCVQAACDWLKGCQQPSGGWGESADSYADPRLRGKGPSTASQTAWAVLGLLAACGPHDESVRRGVRYLVDRQCEDGRWDEPEFTGTGFPLVFYLRYHMYPIYFPLLALGQWSREADLELHQGRR